MGRPKLFDGEGIDVGLFCNPDGELVGAGLRARVELDYRPVVTVVHFALSVSWHMRLSQAMIAGGPLPHLTNFHDILTYILRLPP